MRRRTGNSRCSWADALRDSDEDVEGAPRSKWHQTPETQAHQQLIEEVRTLQKIARETWRAYCDTYNQG
eukprot:2873197-Prorocentrum_lima.AAC.1